ncbi:MAG: hypothetical protein ACK5KL_01405 [Dysgonomonas sp.]|nr:hypothetical protein [Prevotella sp.]
MKEKVYTIHNIWDMTIVEGIADYKGKPHLFCSLSPDNDESGFFSDRYQLTPLTANIFELEMQSWYYWLHWLDMWKKSIKIPHSNEYNKLREVNSYDQISIDSFFTQEEKEKAEENYQRKLIIDHYLNNSLSLPYQLKAEFHGTTDGTSKTEDLFVEWTDLLDRKIS